MTQDQIIQVLHKVIAENMNFTTWTVSTPHLVALVNHAIEGEREVVANWIMDKGFATGHGDSIVDLLDQLEWQIAEKEREACAKVCEELVIEVVGNSALAIDQCARAIRARGQA